MSDFQKSVKRALIFGFCGAVILPIIHECYANISKSIFTVIIYIMAVICGGMFSKFEVKSALVSITAFASVCAALGICIYVVVHPLAVSFLSRVSKYFSLRYIDNVYYYAKLIAAFALVYLVYGVLHLVFTMSAKTKASQEKVKTYIDNAFDD